MEITDPHTAPAGSLEADGSQVSSDVEQIVVDPVCTVHPGLEDPEFEWTNSAINPYARRRFNKNSYGLRGELSGYIPHLKNISDATLRQLPRWLFRVTHSSSCGINVVGAYRSYMVSQLGELGRVDFFSLSDEPKRQQVDDHVSQVNGGSHWISFTDCPLNAMGRALQHVQHKKKDVTIHFIDTLKIRDPALIVSSYAMLRAHRVCVNLHPVEQRKLLGSSYAEFLVWDELNVEASTIQLRDMLNPKSGQANIWTPGLLELLPEFIKPSANKKNLKFRQAWDLKSRLYGLQERIDMELDLRRPRGPRLDQRDVHRAGRMGVPDHLKHKSVQDPRCALDDLVLGKYVKIVDQQPAEVKMVMLAFLLSFKTSTFYEDTIVDELAKLAEEKADFRLPECHVTNMRTPRKPGVKTFQSILAKSFEKAVTGNEVTSGMLNVQKNIIRLDSRKVMSAASPHQIDAKPELRASLSAMGWRPQPWKSKRKRRLAQASHFDEDVVRKKVRPNAATEIASVATATATGSPPTMANGAEKCAPADQGCSRLEMVLKQQSAYQGIGTTSSQDWK